MKALLCHHVGALDDLTLEDIPAPGPGPGEVRIRVRACSINYPDLLAVAGKYQAPPALPFSPGMEIAGEVIECGPGVAGPAPGTRVMALLSSGGLREEAIAKAQSCTPLPDSMDDATAAALTVTYGTAYHALVDRARLVAGETLLVLGASGGVGTAAIDIGRTLGARVIATSASDAKLARLREIYAVDETVNYTTLEAPFKDRINAMTGGRGADVIFDPVGGELFQQCMRCVAWAGRILVIGFAADADNLPQARTNLLLLKGSSLVGVYWGRLTQEDPARARACIDALFRLHADGRITPHISHRFPLERAVAALQTLAHSEVIGKCVVLP